MTPTPRYVPTEGFKGFDPDALRDSYLAAGWLDAAEFAEIQAGTERVRKLGIPGLDWRITAQASTMHPRIPKEAHLRATAAGLGLSWKGPEDFYVHAVERGLLPARTLNRTTFHRLPENPTRKLTGDLMLELGLISRGELVSTLGVQATLRTAIGTAPPFGYLVTWLSTVSTPDYLFALALRMGFEYRSLDQTLQEVDRRESGPPPHAAHTRAPN